MREHDGIEDEHNDRSDRHEVAERGPRRSTIGKLDLVAGETYAGQEDSGDAMPTAFIATG